MRFREGLDCETDCHRIEGGRIDILAVGDYHRHDYSVSRGAAK
jgi:hypothetical protein